jgi:hypothetical protein
MQTDKFIEIRLIEGKKKIDAIKVCPKKFRPADVEDVLTPNNYLCVISEEAYKWLQNKI